MSTARGQQHTTKRVVRREQNVELAFGLRASFFFDARRRVFHWWHASFARLRRGVFARKNVRRASLLGRAGRAAIVPTAVVAGNAAVSVPLEPHARALHGVMHVSRSPVSRARDDVRLERERVVLVLQVPDVRVHVVAERGGVGVAVRHRSHVVRHQGAQREHAHGERRAGLPPHRDALP